MTVPARTRLLLLPRTEAGEEDDEHAEKQEHHGCKTGPHADRVEGMRAFILLVDVVFDGLLLSMSIALPPKRGGEKMGRGGKREGRKDTKDSPRKD